LRNCAEKKKNRRQLIDEEDEEEERKRRGGITQAGDAYIHEGHSTESEGRREGEEEGELLLLLSFWLKEGRAGGTERGGKERGEPGVEYWRGG